jgi:hypothetical protein
VRRQGIQADPSGGVWSCEFLRASADFCRFCELATCASRLSCLNPQQG